MFVFNSICSSLYFRKLIQLWWISYNLEIWYLRSAWFGMNRSCTLNFLSNHQMYRYTLHILIVSKYYKNTTFVKTVKLCIHNWRCIRCTFWTRDMHVQIPRLLEASKWCQTFVCMACYSKLNVWNILSLHRKYFLTFTLNPSPLPFF